MKTAIVPAQVTTVEDKIAGNLSLQQLVLMAAPVFVGAVIYAVCPPSFKAEPYKIIIISTLAVMFGMAAIRIKGKLLFQWIIIFGQYNLRPRYYVFNKNDRYLRNVEEAKPEKAVKPKKTKKTAPAVEAPQIEIMEKARLEQIVANPKAKLAFKRSSKGGLNVYITEIK